METYKLKSCPFCGSDKVRVQKSIMLNVILCDTCGATVSFFEKVCKKDVVQAWNKRNDMED